MMLSFNQKHLRLNEKLRKILIEVIFEYIVLHKVYASSIIIDYISDNII